MILAEFAGFFMFIYGFIYLIFKKWFQATSNYNFVKQTYNLQGSNNVTDDFTGQLVERRKNDEKEPIPNIFDLLTCRARLFMKRFRRPSYTNES